MSHINGLTSIQIPNFAKYVGEGLTPIRTPEGKVLFEEEVLANLPKNPAKVLRELFYECIRMQSSELILEGL